MAGESHHDLWWKNAIVYCLDVETYLDANGDGIGDFRGLSERVDYLAGLGVTCIWLMPFFPSAQQDDGYDICDYYGIDPRLGDLGDFTEFIKTAQAFGIKVIADLVVNHTSDQHAWFQAARADPNSPFRRFYIWADEPPDEEPSIIFPGKQHTNWTFDKAAGQYYFHHFYPHQPDLNPMEPAVRDEMKEIIGFWVQQGLAGFRVDAVPFLIELRGEKAEEEITPHGFLKDLRSFLSRRQGDAILLGEVDLKPHEQIRFFGDGDELDVMFNFFLNQHVYLALARGDADPVRKALELLPPIPAACQWANFIKNHDEQNLSKLAVGEMEEVFEAFAPDESMRMYGRGIRRRLPGMMDGDQRRLRLAYSLIFSLAGTPVLFYGEEIGMGENLDVEGRRAVRSPMQWKPGPNGGFSTADPKQLVRPLTRGKFGPEKVNVAAQLRDPGSILNWMERLIRRRKETPEFGFGKLSIFHCGVRCVLSYVCDWDGRAVAVLHNFSDDECEVSLEGQLDDVIELVDIWSDQPYEPPKKGRAALGPYGYRWIRLLKQGQELLL